MKKLLIAILALTGIASCKKDETTPTNNNNNSSGCGDGFICFNLSGNDISKAAGGYELSDTMLFVKYEEGNKQLSIDIFGKTTGDYNVSDSRKQGNGRIYYFDGITQSDTCYQAKSGKMNISAYDATNKKLTGTFSGTLYKYYSNSQTYNMNDSVVIKNGTFTKVSVPKV